MVIPNNKLLKGSVITCYACGGPVYETKKDLKSLDPITADTICRFDGTPVQKGEKMVCPHCGEPFFTIAIGTAQAVPRDWPQDEL
ncbi:MAG: hypothetical protein BV459_06670 [Thermoplasmata archaeon M11B2D]|nr:MAG: hypothetical protein BV459_06670 [Thermoplasmata archaeon M11B2D]PNX51200.1 MAG: hypothetical protein BV458_11840 [Thermoplasmata archaeon M9B2D]